jgi:hypothetical protein
MIEAARYLRRMPIAITDVGKLSTPAVRVYLRLAAGGRLHLLCFEHPRRQPKRRCVAQGGARERTVRTVLDPDISAREISAAAIMARQTRLLIPILLALTGIEGCRLGWAGGQFSSSSERSRRLPQSRSASITLSTWL